MRRSHRGKTRSNSTAAGEETFAITAARADGAKAAATKGQVRITGQRMAVTFCQQRRLGSEERTSKVGIGVLSNAAVMWCDRKKFCPLLCCGQSAPAGKKHGTRVIFLREPSLHGDGNQFLCS